MEIFGLNPIDPNDLIETDLESDMEFDDMEKDKTFEVSAKKKMDKQDALDEDEICHTTLTHTRIGMTYFRQTFVFYSYSSI